MDAPAAVLAMVTTVTDHLGGTAAPTFVAPAFNPAPVVAFVPAPRVYYSAPVYSGYYAPAYGYGYYRSAGYGWRGRW